VRYSVGLRNCCDELVLNVCACLTHMHCSFTADSTPHSAPGHQRLLATARVTRVQWIGSRRAACVRVLCYGPKVRVPTIRSVLPVCLAPLIPTAVFVDTIQTGSATPKLQSGLTSPRACDVPQSSAALIFNSADILSHVARRVELHTGQYLLHIIYVIFVCRICM
jgi:hypothetical protein